MKPSRRQFLRHSASCAAHVALAASVLPRALRAEWTRSIAGPIVDMGAYERQIAIVPVYPGDVTGDGQIDVSDLLAVLGAWGVCP